MKIFISVPMRNRDERYIRFDIERVKERFKSEYGDLNVDFVFIDNLIAPPKDTAERLYSLGEAIKKIGECDACIFIKGWEKSNGCLVEHKICELYDISIYIEKLDGRIILSC